MAKELTVQDFFKKFDKFTLSANSQTVIIHPNLPYNHIQLTKEFVDKLEKELENKVTVKLTLGEEMDAITKFAIYILENAS